MANSPTQKGRKEGKKKKAIFLSRVFICREQNHPSAGDRLGSRFDRTPSWHPAPFPMRRGEGCRLSVLTADAKLCSRAAVPRAAISLRFLSPLRRAPTHLLRLARADPAENSAATRRRQRHGPGWEETMKLLCLPPLLLS